MMKHALLLSCGLMFAAQGAAAQAPPSATSPLPPTATASTGGCAGAAPASPRSPAVPEGTTTGQAGEPLSDQLAKSDGVVCPPSGVDPEIRAPTPDAGNTPVIPPPGSPGGNPNLRPK
jgi:hypothetical protein